MNFKVMSSDKVLLNSWKNLQYHDPAYILRGYRGIELSGMLERVKDPRERTLRTNKQKPLREGRDAALFCYGLEMAVVGTKVYFAMKEESDRDFVCRYKKGDTVNYTPVQLKEVIFTRSNINKEIGKLKKYPDSKNLVVALKLNGRGKFVPGDIAIPHDLAIGGLWVYGSSNKGQTKWFIFGDMLGNSDFYEFDYPN